MAVVSIFVLTEYIQYKKFYTIEPVYEVKVKESEPLQHLFLTKENKLVLPVHDDLLLKFIQIDPKTKKVEKQKIIYKCLLVSKLGNENRYLLGKTVENGSNSLHYYFVYDFDNDSLEAVNPKKESIFIIDLPKNGKGIFYTAKKYNETAADIFEYDFKTKKTKAILDLTKKKEKYVVPYNSRYNATKIVLENDNPKEIRYSVLNLKDNSFKENLFKFKKIKKK